MRRTIISALQFQVAWFFCVLVHSPLALTLFTLANLWLHLRVVNNLEREPLWLVGLWCAGVALDSLLFASGLLANTDGSPWPPLWLLLLWLNFAMAVRYCFAFLQKNLLLTALLGAIAGPASYLSGAYLNGGVTLAQPLLVSLLVLGVLWGVFLPSAAYVARSLRVNRVGENA